MRDGVYHYQEVWEKPKKSKQNYRTGRAGQDRTWKGRAGQDRTGQGRAGQGRAGQDRAGQGRTGQDRAGQGRTGQDRAGQGRTGQGREGREGQGHKEVTTHEKSGQRGLGPSWLGSPASTIKPPGLQRDSGTSTCINFSGRATQITDQSKI